MTGYLNESGPFGVTRETMEENMITKADFNSSTCRRRNLGRLVKLMTLAVVVLVWSTAHAVSIDEVLLMTRAGVSEQVIIQTVNASGREFDLTDSEAQDLRNQGVTDEVLAALTGGQHGATTPAPSVAGPMEQEQEAGRRAQQEQEDFERARLDAESERMRMEAARSAEDARRMQQASRTIRGSARELTLAQELLSEGDNYGAAAALRSFIEASTDPSSAQVVEARYLSARALYGAGLKFSAAGELVELMQLGPETARFGDGFRMLRSIRREIRYSPPAFESFTRFYLGTLPMALQDEVNYFLGEFFYDYNNFQRARVQFEAISSQSPHLQARAAYLDGLSLVRERRFRSAVDAFERAVTISEGAMDRVEDINHLSYLALARIAFEGGYYDGAIYYYRKIPLTSPKIGDALYEAGWTYFMNGDYRNALGVFHAMHSPYLNYRYHPDLLILEATAYMDLCRYEQAREAVATFSQRYAAMGVNLKQFLGAYPTPDGLYRAFVEAANSENQSQLPRIFVEAVLGNIEFFELYRTVRALEGEVDRLPIEGRRLESFGENLLNRATMQRDRTIIELGIKIQQILRAVDRELTEWQIKATEVTYEIDRGEKDVLDAQIQALYRDEEIEESTAPGARTAGRLLVGDQIQIWPFEGEFWEDELVFYRGLVMQECAR